MKTVNAIIIVMIAAVVFSIYLMGSKVMHKSDSATTAESPATSLPQVEPAPVPRVPVAGREQPAVQHQPVQVTPIKEEPKLRPVGDIKVVMYMTDW